MGEQHIDQDLDERKQRAFMKALLEDLRALERMLETGMIESGVRRLGAEQEMFLVTPDLDPAPVAVDVLLHTADPRFVTEIARFNLEANLTPQLVGAGCLRRVEEELNEVMAIARGAARECGAEVLLAGILPTLQATHLGLENLTPRPRYYELNRILTKLRGGTFLIHMKGLDELLLTRDNIMTDACNTSFQIHLQVGPAEFVPLYNMAQAITAPLLAAAVNSPLLLGHRLWQETRVALFQHSNDARTGAQLARSSPTRVGFGEGWLKSSVLELFRQEIARFPLIMTAEVEEEARAALARGEAPRLSALRLHNGTIWPWNRACYGVSEGRAHLRIENRVLPGGPTILDEMANAAFFLGLMTALPAEYGEISQIMSFDQAKANFFAAARHGLHAQLTWVGGRQYTAPALILDHLLPLARTGLAQCGVTTEEIDRYLGTLEERVRLGQTGAQWALDSLAAMRDPGPADLRHRSLAAAMLAHQQTGEPVHLWPTAEAAEPDAWQKSYQTVGQFMSVDLFTVRPDDPVDLAASVMDWQHIRHVPVEDEAGRLVGLVTHRGLLRLLAEGASGSEPRPVRSVMIADPLAIAPSTPTLEALDLLRHHQIDCLPVVDEGRLVGIITSSDFLAISAKLLEERLGPLPPPPPLRRPL